MSSVEPPGDRSRAVPAAHQSWLRVAKETGNPLLRAPSRCERGARWLGWTVVLLLVAGAIACTLLVYRHGMSAKGDETRARHQVTATVLRWADTRVVGNPYLVASQVDVSYPVGQRTMQGSVTTTDPVQPGSTLQIWIDADGQMVRPPRTLWTVGYDTTLAGLLGALGVGVIAVGLRTWYVAWVQRHHLDEWEAEWLVLDRDHLC